MKLFQSLRAAAVSFLAFTLIGAALPAADNGGQTLVYVGTYTGAKSKGIHAFRMDQKSGALTPLGLAAEITNPTFLAVHPNRKFLYAINEVGSGAKAGGVTAFSIDAASGHLTLLNQQTSGGAGPCHLVTDRKGKNVLLANYGGGSVESLPLQSDGQLGEPATFIQHHGSGVNKSRQEGPHGHCIVLDSADRFAYACDLGLDQVLIYKFNPAKGTLTPNDPPFATIKAGSGPRHIAFHPKGHFAYVINEMSCTMTALACDAKKGVLTEIQTVSTLPDNEELKPAYSTAEVEVHPSGKFLYGSNRGHNTIVVYAIDPGTGRLTLIEHQSTQGKTPRNFGIDPSGSFLLAANQDSHTVVVFRIDAKTGRLTPTGTTAEVGAPVCVKFVPEK
jgi:6-phosphogluconolactonase